MPFITEKVPPSDPILDLTTAFKKCTDKKKIDLGAGTYRNDDNSPVVFSAVKKAVLQLATETNENKWFKEYLPMHGDINFVTTNTKLLIGEKYFDNIAAIQTNGGTGALRVAMETLKYMKMGMCPHTEYPATMKKMVSDKSLPKVHISDPTWPNHNMIIHHAGMDHQYYTYYDPKTLRVDEQGFIKSINDNVQSGDGVLLHAIAHNPTGCDVSRDTYKKVLESIEAKDAVAILDLAYWGFVSGNLTDDKWAIDLALSMPNLKLMICQSYSKNMGLYGDRLGVFSMKCATADAAVKFRGFVQLLSRGMISSCARHASDVAYRIMSTKSLCDEWQSELKTTADRLKDMRVLLRKELEKRTTASWSHITEQRGMFAYTGLTPQQVSNLTEKHAIFLAKSGRISIAGLNTKNIDTVADAIADVIKC